MPRHSGKGLEPPTPREVERVGRIGSVLTECDRLGEIRLELRTRRVEPDTLRVVAGIDGPCAGIEPVQRRAATHHVQHGGANGRLYGDQRSAGEPAHGDAEIADARWVEVARAATAD